MLLSHASEPASGLPIRERSWADFRLLVSVGLLLVATPATALDKHTCVVESESGQRARAEGHLVVAETHLRACIDATCPGVVSSLCARWLDEVDRAIPTVVLGAREHDADLFDVRCSIDGKVVAERLDGRPVPIDPGRHVVVFEHGTERKQIELLTREGEKDRPVTVVFGGPATQAPLPPPPSTVSPLRTVGYVTLGLTLASGTAFGILAAVSHADYTSLATQCGMACPPSRVDPVHTEQVVADVFLVTTVVFALATTAFLLAFATRPAHVALTPLVVRF